MKAVVVYNPKSGSSLPKHVLKKKLTNANINIETFIDVTDNFEKHIKPFVDQSRVIVIGYGGDGTLSSIAKELQYTKTVFAPLPGGTLNHFTKDLGIEQDLDMAITQLQTAKIHHIDIAKINGRPFLNNSSLGLYPSSLAERSRIETKLGKWPAAIFASVRAFVTFRTYTVTINTTEFRTPFLFVGNNNYDIDSLMTRKSLDKGILSVFMVTSNKRTALLKTILLSVIGKARESTAFEIHETKSIKIHIKKSRVRVSFDGEHAKIETPLNYEIAAGALRVLY